MYDDDDDYEEYDDEEEEVCSGISAKTQIIPWNK